jgi:predicted nucleic acid-binding protein
MSARAFVDTNVLVYAHDRGAGTRHDGSRALVAELWRERAGAISTQVVQELYVNLRRKAENPPPAAEVTRLVEDYLSWRVVVNDGASILGAIALEKRYRISFWDALIVRAAIDSGAGVLYSEDLAHGQRYESVEVVNPFRG